MRELCIGLVILGLMFFVAFVFSLMMAAGQADDIENKRWERYEREKQDND